MSQGQGSFQTNQRTIAAPPFPLASANNGLSVDPVSGKIVLGNNLGGSAAQLISDRELPLNGFQLQITDVGNPWLLIDPTTLKANILQAFDAFGATANMELFADSVGNLVTSSSQALHPSGAGGHWQIEAEPGSGIDVEMATGDGLNGINWRLDLTAPVQETTLTFNGHNYIRLNWVNKHYDFGEIDGINNGTALRINDDVINGPSWQIGNFIPVVGNNVGTVIAQQGTIVVATQNQNVAVYQGFFAQDTGRISQMGDISFGNNQNLATIDDVNSKFILANLANNILVNINGVDGFTGTVTPVTTITVNGGIVTNVA